MKNHLGKESRRLSNVLWRGKSCSKWASPILAFFSYRHIQKRHFMNAMTLEDKLHNYTHLLQWQILEVLASLKEF